MALPCQSDILLQQPDKTEYPLAFDCLQFKVPENMHLPKIEYTKRAEECLAWDSEIALILKRRHLENRENLSSKQDYMAEMIFE